LLGADYRPIIGQPIISDYQYATVKSADFPTRDAPIRHWPIIRQCLIGISSS